MSETDTTNPFGSRLPGRGRLKQAAALLPMARYVPRHPAFLVGAAALGVGFLAWRNRERIRRTAAPMLQDAAARGQAMRQRMPWTKSQTGY